MDGIASVIYLSVMMIIRQSRYQIPTQIAHFARFNAIWRVVPLWHSNCMLCIILNLALSSHRGHGEPKTRDN